MVLVFILLAVYAEACSSVVDSSAGLLVDSASTETSEDGSECFPFKTLNAAVLSLSGEGRIEVVQCSSNLQLGPLSVDQPIEIDGLNCSVEVAGQVQVNSQLVIRNFKFSGSLTQAAFVVVSSLSFQNCEFSSLAAPLVTLKGSLSISDSLIKTLSQNFIEASELGISLTVSSCTFTAVSKVLSWKVLNDSDLPSVISFSDSSFNDIPTSLAEVNLIPTSTAAHSLTFLHCKFTRVSLVGSLVARKLTTSVTGSDFKASNFLDLVQFDSSTTFSSNSISEAAGMFLQVNGLVGQLIIKDSSLTSMKEGMFLLVNNSPSNLPKSLVTIDNCQLSNVQNTQFTDNIIRVSFTALQVTRTQVSNVNTADNVGGLLFTLVCSVVIEDCTFKSITGPFVSAGGVVSSTSKLTNLTIAKVSTMAAPFGVNGGQFTATNLDISDYTQSTSIVGQEVAGIALTLVVQGVVKSSRFSSFHENMLGTFIVSDSTNIAIEDVAVEGLIG
jgi:hypothetical protein